MMLEAQPHSDDDTTLALEEFCFDASIRRIGALTRHACFAEFTFDRGSKQRGA